MKSVTKKDLALFMALVGLGVAGRWLGASDRWSALPPNCTPTAAAGLFAGFLLVNFRLAAVVPLAILIVSNLCLESYGSPLVMATVYLSFLAVPMMGRMMRGGQKLWRLGLCVAGPSVLFFLTTNLAVWMADIQHVHRAFSADWQGLAACYAAGVPFFRWMLEGDLLYCGLLFGIYHLAGSHVFSRPVPAQPAATR